MQVARVNESKSKAVWMIADILDFSNKPMRDIDLIVLKFAGHKLVSSRISSLDNWSISKLLKPVRSL